MNVQWVKKIIPVSARRWMKKIQRAIFSFIDSRKPFLREVSYLGFRVFYTPSSGLIERIRPGSFFDMYEPELCQALIGELQKYQDPVFLDIGANIGLVSLTIYKHVPKVHIYAFEPGPSQYKLFSVTRFANRLDAPIDLYNVALGNLTGFADFYTYGEGDAAGDGFIDTGRSGRPLQKIPVSVMTLDTWWDLNQKPKIHVVKMDVEGAELLVLQGGEKFFAECKPVIYFELSNFNLKVYPHSAMDILGWFTRAQYSLYALTGEQCTMQNLAELMEKTDTFIAKSTY
jgi:FkbM family methyltransferase